MLNPNAEFKEQMTEARRFQILSGAAQIFSQKGYHKATTKEIARAAGVSEGTIYNYFENKRELLLAMVELIATQSFRDAVLNQPPADPREFLSLILRDRYNLIKERGHIMVPLIAEIFADSDLRETVYRRILNPVAALVEQYLAQQMEAGNLRRANPAIVTRSLIGTIVMNTALKLTGLDSRYEDISAEAMIEEIISIYLDGLLHSGD